MSEKPDIPIKAELNRGLVDALLDSAPSALLMTDLSGEVIVCNQVIRSLFGLNNEELPGRRIEAILAEAADHFEDPGAFSKLTDRLLAQPDLDDPIAPHEAFERALPLASSARPKISTASKPIRNREGQTIGRLWVFADVTKFLEADEQLHKLVEASPVPLVITRVRDGLILFANAPLARLVALTPKELIGQVSPDFYYDPKDRERFLEMLDRDGCVHNYEVRLKNAKGKPFWGIMSFEKADIAGEAVLIGGVYDIDARRRMEDELRDAHQKLKAAQTQLVQSEKMAALGNLVAGVAHEINTPVGAIHSTHETLAQAVAKIRTQLSEEIAARPKVERLFDLIADSNKVIASGSSRVIDIVRRLRSFARLDEAELKEADLHDGLEDTIGLIHHKLKKNNIEVNRKYGDIPRISCFPRQLNQVFLNLLVNAADESTGARAIFIRTWVEDGFVQVAIRDDGRGIPAADLERVFDPGFTTKGVGVGTGLGLSICYQIMETHKGQIKVESPADGGAVFTVQIPINLDELLGEGQSNR